MSKKIVEIIESIETALKPGLTQKDGLRSVVDKIQATIPIAANAYDYDAEPVLLLKEAASGFRRAFQEAETATRKLSGAIHIIDQGSAAMKSSQRDIFSNSQEQAEPEVKGEPLLLGDGTYPPIARWRTRPGGDAFDSFSLDRLQGVEEGMLPDLRGKFVVDGTVFVTVAMSPGYWIEACEVLSENEAKDLENVGRGFAGQRVTFEDDPFGVIHVLGSRIRFVVPEEERVGPGSPEAKPDPELELEPSGDGAEQDVPDEAEAEAEA